MALGHSQYTAKSLMSKGLSGYYLGCALSDRMRDALLGILQVLQIQDQEQDQFKHRNISRKSTDIDTNVQEKRERNERNERNKPITILKVRQPLYFSNIFIISISIIHFLIFNKMILFFVWMYCCFRKILF